MDSKVCPGKALALFDQGFNCAQAVFAACAQMFGLQQETALKTASAFGGGMNMGAICGALTGAMMVLGLASGFSIPDPDIKDGFGDLNRELIHRFREKVGHIDCRDILEIDPTDKQQKEAARETGILAERCPHCVQNATEIVLNMLHELDIV